MRVAAFAVLGLLLLAPLGSAKTLEAHRAPALAFLADAAADAGPLAANLVEAAAANGLDASTWPTPDDPLARRVATPTEDAAFIALLRPLRALALAGDERTDALAQRVKAGFDGTQFGSATQLNDDAYAILALLAAGVAPDDVAIASARSFLRSHHNADGGWGWAVGGASGVDMTGLVVLALRLSGGATAQETTDAATFIRGLKDGDGYAESMDGRANCESTVWALRTVWLDARGTDPAAWRFLLSLQQRDGGFAHAAGGPSDLLCTAEVAGLLGDAAATAVPFDAGDREGLPGPSLPLLVAALACAVATSMRLRQA